VNFRATSLDGVWVVGLELHQDDRGFFTRTSCEMAFARHGLNTRWPQCGLSYSARRGTLRGLHYQAEPKPETKLIRCVRGMIYDVVVDLRAKSPAFGRWEAFELASTNYQQLYVPAGFAHGFQTLEKECEVSYQFSEVYHPELARGVRWNDPALGIAWPIPDPIVSERDRALPSITGDS
jgi:dTDP-4-dehydrorhamnose 3,5-epimerase